MRKLLIILLAMMSLSKAHAAHLVGGEISYKCVSSAASGNTYQIKLVLYRDCNSSGAAFDQFAPIAVYGGPNQNTLVTTLSVARGLIVGIPAVVANPCLQTPPNVCTEKNIVHYKRNFTRSHTWLHHRISTLLPQQHDHQRC